jgi:hypothetical protein
MSFQSLRRRISRDRRRVDPGVVVTNNTNNGNNNNINTSHGTNDNFNDRLIRYNRRRARRGGGPVGIQSIIYLFIG